MTTKPGPAPKPAAEKQSGTVAVKFTPSELAAVRAAATSRHLPAATWVRALVLDEVGRGD